MLRTLRDADYEAAGALFAAVVPDRADEPARWREDDRQPTPPTRWVVDDPATPDEPAAYAALWRVQDDKFRFDLVVRPSRRRRGIGRGALAMVLDAAREAGAKTLQGRVREGDEPSLAFLERRDFHETMRMHHLSLTLSDALLEPWADVETRLAAQGIVITTLRAEGEEDSAVWERIRDLHQDVQDGWPDPDPGGRSRTRSTDEVRGTFLRFSSNASDYFLARQGERYVGFTGPSGTGVRPAYRDMGVATALKTQRIAHARERGDTVMESASGNPAMIRVNEKFGFRRTWSEVRLVRRMR